MRAVKHPGYCKLCGQFKELTFEHVPPKKAFNSSAVRVFPFDEVIKLYTCSDGRMPWDISGLKGKIQQKGGGNYYLCRECNNNTGSWYIEEYTTLANTLNQMIRSNSLIKGNAYSFKILQMHPLRILKAVMTMFCDINHNCFGDDSLRQFLLQKESQNFDANKYSVYMFLTSPNMSRLNEIMAQYNLKDGSTVLASEIIVYPMGFALYINKPENFKPIGLCINDFCKFSYNHKCEVGFTNIPYIEINSQFPLDYRTKEQILSAIEDSKSEEA